MGRITASTQSTGGAAYPFSYTYWLNGALASVTYPSGRQMAYTLDTAGRVSSVTGTLSGTPTNYVSGVQYKPWNAIQQLSMQNGLTETWTYNARMQPFQATAAKSGSTLLTLNTWYCTGASPAQDCATNNGNIMQAWAGPSATPAYKQTFGYDSLNRLSSATEGAPWAQSYGYDIFGNRWATGTGPGIDSTTPSTSAWYDATTNHVVNALLPVAYDDAGAGNLKTLSGYLFSYDGENRMVRSTLNGIDTNYAYDGDGRRVQKTGSNSTTFVYDARGALAAEYSTQAPPVAGTEYVTVDHLGSTRLTTNANGNPIAYHDYVPFGAEIPAGVNGRSNLYGAADGMNKKFTGQYRDTETQSSAMTSGLDYFGARYFSAAQGRFTTPDWSETPEPVPYADFGNPQTLNLYTYARNNPLTDTDPDGHCATLCTGAIGFVVGGLAGGAWEAGKQLIQSGKITNGKAILASAAGGAVSGGLAGLTLGTSLGMEAGFVATGVVSGGANVVGGGVTRAINGQKVLDPKAAGADMVAGFAGGVVGKAAANATVKALVPSASGQAAVNSTFNPSPYDTVYTSVGNVTVGGVQRVVQSSSNAAGNVVSNGVGSAVPTSTPQSPPPPRPLPKKPGEN